MTDAERIKRAEAIRLIFQYFEAELDRAEYLHPIWPAPFYRGDHVRAVARLMEEAGETQKAVLNYEEGKGSLAQVKKEAIEAGAMALRFLYNLEAVERQRLNEAERQDLQEEHNVDPQIVEFDDFGCWTTDNIISYPQGKEGLLLDDKNTANDHGWQPTGEN